MRQFPAVASSLMALLLCGSVVKAETPPSPLRLVPDQADLLIQMPQPRRLVETLIELDTFKQLRRLAPVRELFDSTNARRLLQLVAYFEKELGLPWPQLLDRLSGRGAVLGVQFGPNPTPLLLVIEGEDDKLMQQFFQLGLKIVEQELARQEAKEKPIKGSYKDYNTVHIGAEFHAAVAGAALFLSNSEKCCTPDWTSIVTAGRRAWPMCPAFGKRPKCCRRSRSSPSGSTWRRFSSPQERRPLTKLRRATIPV